LVTGGFAPFAKKMMQESLPEAVIRTFENHYSAICKGATGLVTEKTIRPVDYVPCYDDLSAYRKVGEESINRLVLIKLNGGLGTSMGMTYAKSLLPARGKLTFLDIIARQTLAARARYRCRLPLLLMSSGGTQHDCRKTLMAYDSLPFDELPLDFLQHKVPRISTRTLAPIEWPEDPSLEWCPPGHGDIYAALKTSGVLNELQARGFRYAFVSNADNLAASLDVNILGWMCAEHVPFVLEVAKRTENDKKGGHLAQTATGKLIVRETTQCPTDEIEKFQDIERYQYFNTNNLWIDLRALEHKLDQYGNNLPLPLMVNKKYVVANDADSPQVFQTETAMGAGVSLFDNAKALLVSRERFVPVKTTNDLLKLWSDLYTIDDDFGVLLSGTPANDVIVDLDPVFYRNFDSFYKRFPFGAPLLSQACELKVNGDILFGSNVVIKGCVNLSNESGEQMSITSGSSFNNNTV